MSVPELLSSINSSEEKIMVSLDMLYYKIDVLNSKYFKIIEKILQKDQVTGKASNYAHF